MDIVDLPGVLTQAPGSAAATNEFARRLYRDGRHEAAARWFQRLAALDPAMTLEARLNACLALALISLPGAADRCLQMLAGLLIDVGAPAALDLIAQCALKALETGSHETAVVVTKRSRALSPGEPTPLLLAARLARRDRDGERTRRMVRRLRAATSAPDTLVAGVVVLKGLGPGDEPLSLVRRIICQSPGHAEAMAHASDLLARSAESGASAVAARRALAIAAPDSPLALQVAANLATGEYMADRPKSALSLLRRYPGIQGNMPGAGAASILSRYVRLLAEWRLRHGAPAAPPDTPRLYYFGDSHSLSAHGIVTPWRGKDHLIQSLCLPGQTARSLARNIGTADIADQIGHLPRGAAIIFGFGEVDCRPAGHLMAICRTDGVGAMRARVAGLAADLTRVLLALASSCRVVGFAGAPAPNMAAIDLSPEEIDAFQAIVPAFNEALSAECRRLGLAFIDLSAGSDTRGVHQHIDSHHLTPEAMSDALRQSLSKTDA